MENFWFVTLLSCLSLVIIKYRSSITAFIRYRYLVSKLPCLPGALPVVGHTYMSGKTPQSLFEWMVVNPGKYFMEVAKEKMGVLWLGPVPFLFLYHPDLVESLLCNYEHLGKGNFYQLLKPWLRSGLVLSSVGKWTVRRKLLTPTFHVDMLDAYMKVIDEEGVKLTNILNKKLDAGGNIDIERNFLLCTLDIICRTAMGTTINAQENSDSPYVKALTEYVYISEIG